VPLPGTGRLQRVDGVHPVAGSEQGLHPRAAFGLDADDHLIGVPVRPGVGGQQGVEPVDAGNALLQASGSQPPAALVLDLDVVVVLGPVISHVQHALSHPRWLLLAG